MRGMLVNPGAYDTIASMLVEASDFFEVCMIGLENLMPKSALHHAV
jgi:hypothetical protein